MLRSIKVHYDKGIIFILFFILESTELAKQIIPHVDMIPIDFVNNNPLVIENENELNKLNDKSWSSIIVKEGLFEEMRNELILNDYPHIQFIHIQEDSFKNISSLTISNLPELKYLIFEDDSFSSTTSLTLSSIF